MMDFFSWKKEIFTYIKNILGKSIFELNQAPMIDYKKYYDLQTHPYKIATRIIIESDEFKNGQFNKPFVVIGNEYCYFIDK